ncbi:MAG: recombination mediator RecR [Candidatus Omnitrophota bacterium]|nr:recombination mediator RecR [Candidatus Omnitrophota bacterium]
MTKGFPSSMTKLIEEFCKMPGLGSRSAERLAFYVLQSPKEKVKSLMQYIAEVKNNVRFCRRCNNLSEKENCLICLDPARDSSKLCVVGGPNGVIAMEKIGTYNGLYHVLLGELSPIDGIGPDELKIDALVRRIKPEDIREIIIATDFTTEGETTALYLAGILRSFSIKVSRLARGVPVGAVLQYADVATIQRAFEERTMV